jgi:hypothetical protein
LIYGQEKDLHDPIDPYPVTGKAYELIDSTLADTLFISNCEFQAWSNEEVIARSKTDQNGSFKLLIPVKYYTKGNVVIKSNCNEYLNTQGITSLFGNDYPWSGQYVSFELTKK